MPWRSGQVRDIEELSHVSGIFLRGVSRVFCVLADLPPVDASEALRQGGFSVQNDLHIVRALQILHQGRIGEHGGQSARQCAGTASPAVVSFQVSEELLHEIVGALRLNLNASVSAMNGYRGCVSVMAEVRSAMTMSYDPRFERDGEVCDNPSLTGNNLYGNARC